MEHLKQFAGHAKPAGRIALGASLALGGLAILGVMEWSAAAYAIETAPRTDLIATPFGLAPRDAVIYASLSVLFGLLAYGGKISAAIRKDDERPHVRNSAWQANLIATCMMLVPVGNFAHSIAFKDARRAFEVNRPSIEQPEGSSAWQRAMETIEHGEPDDPAVREAQRLVNPPSKGEPEAQHWAMAIALAWLAMQCGSAFRVPLPVTPEERAAMIAMAGKARRNSRRRERRRERREGRAPAKQPAKTWPFVKA